MFGVLEQAEVYRGTFVQKKHCRPFRAHGAQPTDITICTCPPWTESSVLITNKPTILAAGSRGKV
jgi:hypothetical protein